jgi:IS30 family transposase
VGEGTDIGVNEQSDLDAISHRVNTIPRRMFRWQNSLDRYAAVVVAAAA